MIPRTVQAVLDNLKHGSHQDIQELKKWIAYLVEQIYANPPTVTPDPWACPAHRDTHSEMSCDWCQQVRLAYQEDPLSPYLNLDYQNLSDLAQDFFLEAKAWGFENAAECRHPLIKKFMEFRNLAMAVCGKKHDQVSGDPGYNREEIERAQTYLDSLKKRFSPPDPIQAVLTALDEAKCHTCIRGDNYKAVILHPKQIEGLKVMMETLIALDTNPNHPGSLWRRILGNAHSLFTQAVR